MKITDDIFKSIFNEGVWISITISLKFVPKGPIDYKSALVQVMAWHRTGEKPLPELMLTKFTDAYHDTALGGNKITKSGRSFHWGLVHLVQSASLCWNSPKYSILYLKRSLSVPSHYQYCLQIIDIHPRAISQNISKMWWQFFLCICQWSMSSLASPVLLGSQWVKPCLRSPMHEWAARAAKPDTDPASSLKIACIYQTALMNIMFHSREWSTCLLNWGKIYGYSYIWHNRKNIWLFIYMA